MHSDSLKIQLFNRLKNNKKYLLHIPLGIIWVGLFIATSIPTDALPSLFGISDKLEHFSAYLVLSFFITLTLFLRDTDDIIKKYYLVAGVVISVVYGAFDEIHQLIIPGRYCEFYDFLANVLGSISGSLIVYYMLKYVKHDLPISK